LGVLPFFGDYIITFFVPPQNISAWLREDLISIRFLIPSEFLPASFSFFPSLTENQSPQFLVDYRITNQSIDEDLGQNNLPLESFQ